MMDERNILNKGQAILLAERHHSENQRTFHIVNFISAGSTVVCYEAFHKSSSRGILKEFYPQSAYGLERISSGQLIHSPDYKASFKRFIQDENRYIETYEMLLAEKQKGEYPDLATFIPYYEIYYGCDSNGQKTGTTYIWTPHPKLETFEKMCSDIHAHPLIEPEHKLVLALNSILSLTECICSLHCAGMIHRDIKPSNFGFMKRGNDTMTQSISIVDVDSICSVYRCPDKIIFTEGYNEPEIDNELPCNQTDIYSIGATLFHAIVITDETKNSRFNFSPRYYGRLQNMVSESELICASETNSHPYVKYQLTAILKKCLCIRAERYANCEELIADIKKLLSFLIPYDTELKVSFDGKITFHGLKTPLDKNAGRNSFLSIQYHLYQYPLYQYSGDDKINVLVVGLGNYGQKFLDACLQNGQMHNKTLNVTVVSDQSSDKKIYLSERPQLSMFFNIDGSLRSENNSYGNISFKIRSLDSEVSEKNIDYFHEMIRTIHPGYVFISVGNDSVNLMLASELKAAAEELHSDCHVCFACENEKFCVSEQRNTHPLFVNKSIKKNPLYHEIERMAFNSHLVWEKNLNMDYKAAKGDFNKKYNHDSCVSNVLSIKYKLYSIGIDLGTVDHYEAACRFHEWLSKDDNIHEKDELIWTEHRRWVTEKLCLGWQGIDDLYTCIDGQTKDEKHKRHICIRKSRADQLLSEKTKENGNLLWDDPTVDLNQFDDLDRMSVEIHRLYVQRAKEISVLELLSDPVIHGIRNLTEEHKQAFTAFQEWYACLLELVNDDRKKLHLFKSLTSKLIGSCKCFTNDIQETISNQIKLFISRLNPVLESMEYRIWKDDDVYLIENIPFILTYSLDMCMAIPCCVSDEGTLIRSMLAAAVVNPSHVMCFFLLGNDCDIRSVWKSINKIPEFFHRKQIKAKIECILFYRSNLLIPDSLERQLTKGIRGHIDSVKLLYFNSDEEFTSLLSDCLIKAEKGKKPLFVENNSTVLSGILQQNGFFEKLSSYSFDSEKQLFIHTTGKAGIFNYIHKRPFFSVSDFAFLTDSIRIDQNSPEFFRDYKKLWLRYNESEASRKTWKMLCKQLAVFFEKADKAAVFKKLYVSDNIAINQLRYFIPSSCIEGARKVIKTLTDYDVISHESSVIRRTTDSCEITIFDRFGFEMEYEKLFSNHRLLVLPDRITVQSDAGCNEISILSDELNVSGFELRGEFRSEIWELLKFLKDMRFITYLHDHPDKSLSFSIASRQIKQLITSADRIHEVYLYHHIKECDIYDDVVCGVEIRTNDENKTIRFDCAASKGFKLILFKYKDPDSIEPMSKSYFHEMAEIIVGSEEMISVSGYPDEMITVE